MALGSSITGSLVARDLVVRSSIAGGGMDAACRAERRSTLRPLGTGTNRGTHDA